MGQVGSESYDVFVSYAREDDRDGHVAALVAALRAQHRRVSNRDLAVFFDRASIRSMDDWRHRLLAGLRGSRLLVAVLSPAFVASPYCREEVERYLMHESRLPWRGLGTEPIYVVTATAFEATSEADLPGWIVELRRRHYEDLRPWWGADPSTEPNLARHLAVVEQQLADRLGRAELAGAGPSNLPSRNPGFEGRREELRRLHELLALDGVGAAVVVQGLGGMGKTALALEYAQGRAADYPGGRLMLRCEGCCDLREPLAALAAELGMDPGARLSLDQACAWVRAKLDRGPRRLLLLDNVTEPALLSRRVIEELLPATDQLHILATSRVEAQRLAGLTCLPLGSLAEPDALHLIERLRALVDAAERRAAEGIVTRLGGYALAVEVVGVFLSQNEEVSCADYLSRLEAEGIGAVEGVAPAVELSRHPEASLARILKPTLAALSRPEWLAMAYAALLPEERVALPWLRELVGREHPEMVAPQQPGYPDPWRQVERRLTGLRLLAPGQAPQLARIHRLVAEVVRWDNADDGHVQRTAAAIELGTHRAESLEQGGWYQRESAWEVDAMLDWAERAWSADAVAAAELAHTSSTLLWQLGRYEAARRVITRALQAAELPLDGHGRAKWYSNLALVEKEQGHPERARELLREAVELDSAQLGPDDLSVALRLSNLAMVDKDLGDLAAAEAGLRQAIEIRRKVLDEDDPQLGKSYTNLAAVLDTRGDRDAALELLRRVVATGECRMSPDDPTLAAFRLNLARVEREMGHPATARGLLLQVLAVDEACLGCDHPHIASDCLELAAAEQALGDCAAALAWARRGVTTLEREFDADHPRLAAARAALARMESVAGLDEAARGHMRQAHAALEVALGADHPETVAAAEWLAAAS